MKSRNNTQKPRKKSSPKRGVQFQKLEDRILFSATPAVTVDAPGEVKIGETANVKVSFDNADAADAGYGPWVDVFIDATGPDGQVDPADPGNPQAGDTDGIANPGDKYDGFTLTGNPTYLGSNVTKTLLTLDDLANGGKGVEHPYAVDATGAKVFVSTSDPTSPYHSTLNGSYTSGDQLLVLQLPFGSFTPGQPNAEISFNLSLSDHADANTPLKITALGGFQFGNDPLDNPATDPSIIGTPNSATATVGVDLATLSKSYNGPENETATGPNYVRTYRINVDIATGQTLSNLHIFDDLPDEIQFKQISASSDPYTVIGSLPSTTVPGGKLAIEFDAAITGTSGTSDAWIDVEFYVPRVYDSNLSGTIDAGDAAVLSPNSGADHLVDNQAYGYGVWTPIDPRDPGSIVGLKVDAGFDPTDLTTALATAAPNATPEHSNLETSPLVIQKGFSTITDVGAPGHTPGDLLEYTLDFQVSDYFAFDHLTIDDVMLDGLRFDASFVPTLQINGNTFTLTALGWTAANYTVSQNFTGAVASGNFTLDPAVNDGSTALQFRISDELITRGQDGKLIGGGIDPSAPTPGIANDLTGYNDGATTGRITYRAQILDKFTDTFPSGEASLNPRDVLSNSVNISGDVLDLATGAALTAYAGPVISSDNSGASLSIKTDNVQKTIYAVNGNTDLSAFIDPNGKVNLQPGDVITYRFTYTIPSGDVENLRFTDFLPLPIFDVDDINADGTANGLAEWNFVDNTGDVSLSDFTAGVITYGPTHTLNTVSDPAAASPVLMIDSATNSVKMQWGDFVNTVNDAKVVDILLSATVSSDPFADALFLTNQVQSGEGNTQSPGSESLANAIVQIVINEPDVSIHKGVVASTQGGSVGTVGGLTFDTVGGAGFTGTLVGESNAALIGDLNLDATTDVDAGDLVRFALVAVNSGRSDAYDFKIQDTLVGSYVNNYADKAAFMAATNFKALRGDGTLLTEGADYTLTWNAGTKTFEVEMTDNYTAGNLAGDTKPGGVSRGYQSGIDAAVTNGSNGVVILYDLTVDTDAQASSTVTNTAVLTNYAGDEGAFDHTAEDKSDTASIVIDSPGFTKVLTSTSVTPAQDPNNAALNQAVIGETVTYTFTIAVGEGTTAGATVVDTMDAGLAFVGVQSVTYSAGVSSANTIGTGAAPTNVTVGSTGSGTGNLLTFDFGNLTNTDTNNATDETITIVYSAVVVNTNSVPASPGNQAGTQLNNSAELGWSWVNDPDDALLPNPEGTSSITSSAANVTVIEPSVSIDTQASKDNTTYTDSLSGVDAGDFVYYRIRLTNAAGNPTAFDLDLTDNVPSNLGSLTVISAALTNASGGVGGTIAVTDGGPNTLDTSDFAFAGNTLSLAGGRNIDLGADSRLEIVVRGTLDYAVVPNQTLSNTADVTWTSIDGTPGTVSTHNTNSTERTGADGTGTDAAVLNNYKATDPTSLTITSPTNTKSLVATSEDFTTLVSGTERVAVGEIVRYRLVIQIPEGSLPDLQIVDALPTGMLFVNDGTAMVGFISDDNTKITSTTLSGAGLNVGAAIAQPTFVLTDASISTSSNSNLDGWNSDTDPRFKLGDVQNLEDDANAEYIVIEFNAVVLNTPSTGNQNDTRLRNNFTTDINGTTTVGTTSNNVDVWVAEPNLTISQSASTVGPLDAGDTFTYTITVTNNSDAAFGANSAPAFDVRIQDALDAITAANPTAELEFLSYSLGALPGGTTLLSDASSTATDTLDLTFNRLDAGQSVTITVNAQVKAGSLAAAEVESKAVATYTSLPGTAGTVDGTVATTYGTTDVDLNPGTDSTLASALAGTTVSGGTLTTLTTNTTERTGADSEATANDNTPPANNTVRNNYAVAANAPANLMVASPTIDKSFKDGSISADDTSVATSSLANVVIGETVTYDLLVTLPEGITGNLRVQDIVPAGLRIDSMQILTTSASTSLLAADFNGSFATTPTLAAPASGSSTITFDFDDVTVVDDNVANNNSFVIRLVATVENIPANQETITRTNTARVVFNDPDGTGNAGPAADRTITDANPGNDPTVTIVEPTLTILKAVSGAVADAGDPITYTITISNTSGQAAYEVLLSDVLDSALTSPTIVSVTATGFAGGTFTTPTLTDFEISGSTLQVKPAFDLDMNDGSQIVITVSATISNSVTTGQIINNKSDVSWTSTDGTNADERSGADDPNPDATTPDAALLDNYAVSSPVTTTAVATPVVSQSIVDTSHAGTTGETATIGEFVTYRVTVTLPEGVTPGMDIDVALPPGYAFVPGSIVLDAAHPDETSLNDSHAGTGTTAFAGTGLAAPTASRIAGAGNFENGDGVRFTFGSITTTGDNDVNNNTFSFTYQALVLDVASNDGLAPGLTTLTPTGTWTAGVTSGGVLVDANDVANPLARGATATVVEPELNIVKTRSVATADAGNPLTYTLTIDHTAASQANAYNLKLDDVLPGAFVPTGFTALIGVTDVSADFSLTGNTFATDADGVDLLLGQTLTIVFTGNVADTLAPGANFNNSATLGYNTLPNGSTAQQGDFISDVSGVDDGTDRERQTADSDAIAVTVPSTLTLAKSLLSTDIAATSGADFAIGETGTFQLAVTLQQGLTSRVTVNDDLPTGMALQSGTLVFKALTAGTTAVGLVSNTVYTDGSVIDAADISYNSGTGVLAVSLKDVQIPATAATGTGQFAVEYAAKATNTTGSDNGDVLTNSATVSADRNGDGDTTDGGETTGPETVSITIVEPQLAIAKTIITPTTGIDAGDTVTYQIVVSHLGSSAADAYDLILDDVLPSAALENFTLVSAVISDGATTTDISGSFNLTGAGVLSTTGNIDLLLNTNGTNDQALTITVSTTVKDALAVGTSFTNTAGIKWSSLDGGLDGDDAGTVDERTGAGANPPNDYTLTDSVTAATVGTLGVTKGVDKANATIGEIVTYTVTVTVAEGQTVLNLADTLPSGLTLVSNSAALTTPAGWAITGFDTDSASQMLTVSNPGGSGATANNAASADTDTFTYTYQAVVTNVLGNQSGTSLVNDLDGSADLNSDGDTADLGETDNNNTATVTVVEPRVTIDKTALPVSGLDAGDVVTYTVTLDNLAANGATNTAFDVALSDTVPSGLLITGITSTTLSGGATLDAATSITGGGTGLSGQYDIPVGGSVTIVYTATVQTSIVPGQSLVNDADATFTSLDGTVSGERNGSGVAEPADNTHPTDAGTLNNYGVGDSITVTALSYAPLVTKAIVTTSEAGSTGTNVLVGEVVRYSLKFELFEGTLNDLVIQDLLPAGLQFLNDGTASFSTVNVAASVTNTAFLARDSSTGVGTTFTDGTDVFFQLGNVVNNDNDADVEYGVIEFNAIVLNAASNQNAVALNNNFAVLYDADNNAGTAPTAVNSLRVDANDDGTPETTGQSVSNTVTVTVREAALSFTETIPAGTGYDAGDVFTITYTVANNGTAPAYNVRLADLALPAEFDVTAISGSTTGSGTSSTAATDLGNDSVDASLDVLEVGETWTVTATVTLRDTVNPGDVYTNPADVTFTSLPGASGTTGNATGSDTPGAAGTATGERTGADGVGGALNDYALADTAGLSIPTPFSVTKAANKSTATIGEVVTYTINVTVIEGTTTNIVLNDTLPSGMSFVAGSATITNAAGMTITGFVANSLDQTLTSVVNPGANEASANTTTATGTFTYTYQAVVLDVAGNDGITASGDGDGQTSLVNDLDASADGVSPDNNNTATVTVVEPRLEITKANNDLDGVVVPGQVVTYTLTISNLATNGSSTTAYDVRVRDLVPASLTLTVGSINVLEATVTNNSSAGNTLDLTLDSLALGNTATVTFTATVGAGVSGGDIIDNNAKIFYDSLAADEGTAPATGNTVFGDTDGSTGDRDYGSTGPDEVYNLTTDIHQDTERLTVGSFTLGDRVWFDLDGDGVQDASEIGIGGVTVTLLYAGNDGIFGNADDVSMGSVDTTTGTGAYLFSNLANGNYRVTVDSGDLPDGAASVATFDLDGLGTLHTTDVTLAASNVTTADFGYRGSSSISNRVFFDANKDGDQDAGEVGLSGIDLTLRWAGDDGVLDTADDLTLTTATNASGDYLFSNLFGGSYRVDVDQADLPSGVSATPTSGGSTGNISVGVDPITLTGATALGIGENRTTVDFGYTGTGSLGDFVFHDADGDGVQDVGEYGLAGIDITLTWAGQNGTLGDADDVVYTTTTDATGGYLFSNLAAGTFRVDVDQADLPAGLTVLTSGAGSVGSDPLTLTGGTALGAGENRTSVDFGYTGTGSLGDRVWYDVNGDGIQDVGEVGISGATVQLTWAGLDGDLSTLGDNLTFTAVTDTAGNYTFSNLPIDIAGGLDTGLFAVTVLTGTLPAGFDTPTFDLDGTVTPSVAQLSLTSGTPTRTDVDFGYRGTGALGNRVYHDTNGNGSFDAGDLGLSGVDVTLRWAGQDGTFGNADDVVQTTTTNATGNYGFANLVAGDYRVDLDNADLPTGITTITSGGSGADVSVGTDPFTTNLTAGENDQSVDFGYRGTGSIGDFVFADLDGDGVQDAYDYGLDGVTITLTWAGLDGDFTTAADNVVYTTSTAGGGLYSFANLAPGNYRATVSTATLPAGYTVATFDLDGVGTAGTTDTTLTNGQTRTDVDFGYKGTGSISDTVWMDADGNGSQNGLEPGLVGVTLDLIYDVNNDGLLDGGDIVVATTTTDSNGNYAFTGLVPDRYLVRVTDTGNVLASATNTYDKDDYGTAALNSLAAVDLSAGENDSGVDFGYQGAASLGDRVWNDRNADGVQDAGEFGVAGLTVDLYRDLNGDGDYADAGEGLIGTTTTGVNGAYSFSGLVGGSYIVELPTPPASATNTFDKDDYGTVAKDDSAKVSLGATEADLAVDFGYQGSASIGDYVWYDANNDGVQDAFEPPIAGVRVFLDIDGSGTWDSATEPSATTDAAGAYSITGLVGGTYTAIVDISTLPAGYVATYDRDGNTSADTTTFALGGAQSLTDADFGYIGTLTVSGRSYHDLDKSGAFAGTDTGLGGVTIELIWDANNDGTVDAGDSIIYTTTTGANGTYSFATVISGNYLIRETQLAGYGSLENGNLIDIAVAGASVTGQNFGNTTGSIAGTVFSDLDDDGIQDPGELGIAGTTVRLEWSGGDGIFGNGDDRAVTLTTDALGNYLFDHTNTAGFVANGDSTRGLLSTGSYRIIETTPTGFIDGADAVGNAATAAGSVTPGTESAAWLLANPGIGRGSDVITGIQIGDAQGAAGYTFGEILPSSIAGSVHEDTNNNGRRDAGEAGIAASTIQLSGNDIYGRPVVFTTTTNGSGGFTFANLYASSAAGYQLSQLFQPSSYNDGLEGAGSAGGFAGIEFIRNIVLGTNVNASNYSFGELVIPPVVQPGTSGLSTSSSSPSILSGYFYNVFENFLGDSEDDDEDLNYLLEEPLPPEPILPIMPIYSGHAEPGSTIVIEIRNVRGATIGTETVVADAGGNWLAKFPSNIIYDTPTSVIQTVTRPSYSDAPDEDFNFRTNFSPAINPSHFFTQPFDVDMVFAQDSLDDEDTIEESMAEPQNFDWNGFNYEFLAEPGVPSA